MINFNDQLEIAGKALNIPLYTGLGYYSGQQIGQGLGLDEDSQRRFGRMSALNSGLQSTATLFDSLHKRKEVRDRFDFARSQDYVNLPFDRYNYNPNSNTQNDGNFLQQGGLIAPQQVSQGSTRINNQLEYIPDVIRQRPLTEALYDTPELHKATNTINQHTLSLNKQIRESGYEGRLKVRDPKTGRVTFKKGGIPTSKNGLYDYPRQPVNVPSGNITMKGIDYDVLAIPNGDDPVLMKPNRNYKFPNSTNVLELPQLQDGGEVFDATPDSETEGIFDATPVTSELNPYTQSLGFPSQVPQTYSNPNAPKGGTIAVSHNNPGNIKMGRYAEQFGATAGRGATDGGVFAVFPDIDTGLKAQRQLLLGKNYRQLSVDKAMRRWSNSGYGGEIFPAISGKKMEELTEKELLELQRRQIKREDNQMYKLIYNA